jgi:hypothetical protein
MKLNEFQNMIYVKLRSVNLPATVTNKRSHVAKGLVENAIKKYETGEISRLQFVSTVSYRYKKNDIRCKFGLIVLIVWGYDR